MQQETYQVSFLLYTGMSYLYIAFWKCMYVCMSQFIYRTFAHSIKWRCGVRPWFAFCLSWTDGRGTVRALFFWSSPSSPQIGSWRMMPTCFFISRILSALPLVRYGIYFHRGINEIPSGRTCTYCTWCDSCQQQPAWAPVGILIFCN